MYSPSNLPKGTFWRYWQGRRERTTLQFVAELIRKENPARAAELFNYIVDSAVRRRDANTGLSVPVWFELD